MKDIKENYVNFQQACKLKLLGFQQNLCDKVSVILNKDNSYHLVSVEYDVPSEYTYTNINVPLKAQVFEFFRERFNLHCSIELNSYENEIIYNGYVYNIKLHDIHKHLFDVITYNTYDETETELINQVININIQLDEIFTLTKNIDSKLPDIIEMLRNIDYKLADIQFKNNRN